MYFEKSDSLKLDFTKKPKQKEDLTPFQEEDLNRLIEMAWQDRTTFDIIFQLYGLTQNQVQKKMRALMKKAVSKCGEKECKIKPQNTKVKWNIK